jgi:lactocepin
MVPDLGVAEAYADLDVNGKIAVISRGEITFEEKVAYASAAGAAGVIVYNNQDGALVSTAVTTKTIPAVFVSQEAGAALAAYAEAKLTVNEEKSIVKNPDGWSMSSFTSWGPTNDLQIKPTITGIGGNVNSVLNGTENGYTVNSGTSMATPNVAGGYAAYLEAIYAVHPDMSKEDAAALARNRTLSHATVAIDYADQADAFFPDLDKAPDWEITAESGEQTYFDIPYEFVKYERRR